MKDFIILQVSKEHTLDGLMRQALEEAETIAGLSSGYLSVRPIEYYTDDKNDLFVVFTIYQKNTETL